MRTTTSSPARVRPMSSARPRTPRTTTGTSEPAGDGPARPRLRGERARRVGKGLGYSRGKLPTMCPQLIWRRGMQKGDSAAKDLADNGAEVPLAERIESAEGRWVS